MIIWLFINCSQGDARDGRWAVGPRPQHLRKGAGRIMYSVPMEQNPKNRMDGTKRKKSTKKKKCKKKLVTCLHCGSASKMQVAAAAGVSLLNRYLHESSSTDVLRRSHM